MTQQLYPAGTLVGVGATDEVWSSLHREVQRRPNGLAYSPQTVYDPLPDGTNRFAAVAHSEGLIIGFLMQFPRDGVSADSAKRSIGELLPSDVQIRFDHVFAKCEIVGLQSATIGREFSKPKIGDPEGLLLLTLSSLNVGGGDRLEPAHVTEANLTLGHVGDDKAQC